MRVDDNFFYVAITTPFFALIPKDVYPLATAARAFSIWGSLPFEANVVNEKSLIFKIRFKNNSNNLIVLYTKSIGLMILNQF